MARVRRVIDEGVVFYEQLLAERGVDLVRLPARFVSPHELEAGDLRIVFSHALTQPGHARAGSRSRARTPSRR